MNNRMVVYSLMRKALIVVAPLWVWLILDVYVWDNHSLGALSGILHVPGVTLMLLLNSSWEQLHNYGRWQYLLGDFLFYYLLVLLVLSIVKRSRKNRMTEK
jgi:hypothetical protein